MKRLIAALVLILGSVTHADAGEGECRDLYTRFKINGKSFLPGTEVHSSSDGLYIITPGVTGSPFPKGQKYRIQLYPTKSGGHVWCFERVDWAMPVDARPPATCPAPSKSLPILADNGVTVLGMVDIDEEHGTVSLFRNVAPSSTPRSYAASPDKVELKVRVSTKGSKSRLDSTLTAYNENGGRITSFTNSLTETDGEDDLDPKVVKLSLKNGQHYRRKRGCGEGYEKIPASEDSEGAGTGANGARTR